MYLAEGMAHFGRLSARFPPCRCRVALLTITAIADRILCWELVSKRNSNWILHYVKSASAITDVPDGVSRPTLSVVEFTSAYAYILFPGPRVGGPAETMAQRFILRCHTLDSALRLYLSILVSWCHCLQVRIQCLKRLWQSFLRAQALPAYRVALP